MLRGPQYLLASKGGQDFILMKIRLLGVKYIKEKYLKHCVVLLFTIGKSGGIPHAS